MAASATFALKAGVWVRRVRLLIVSPDSRGTACPLSGRNSTYRPVQISGAGSDEPYDQRGNRYHYDSHDQLRAHLVDFVTAYNFARRRKILKGLSPYEYICSTWTKEPGRFILDPIHQMPGLNN